MTSNHVLHHLDGRQFGALLADSERLAGDGGIAVHGDIERTRLGYVGFALGTLPFERNLFAGSYIRARRPHLDPAQPHRRRARRGAAARMAGASRHPVATRGGVGGPDA